MPENERKLIEDTIMWWRLEELAGFALARHGYGNDGFGVTYPADLDPDEEPMLPNTVEVYGDFGAAYSIVVPETTYLGVLADVLRRNGRGAEAETIIDLSDRLTRS